MSVRNLAGFLLLVLLASVARAQDSGFQPVSAAGGGETAPQGAGGLMPQDPPSLPRPTAGPAPVASGGELPSGAGQQWREYDLRSYTGYLTNHERPQQAVVDWVLRETGTDVWFTEPFGLLNARRDTLAVYHTPEMQALVRDVVDRFIAGPVDPQMMSLRIMTVGSPNWRSRALPLLTDVSVQSPGVQAWLVSKENTAVLLSMLRSRMDTRELHASDLVLYNGQSETIGGTRGRNYVRSIRPGSGWPPYEPELGEVQEGYQLEFSPLLAADQQTIDVVVRANIDQIEKLVPVELDLPLPNGQTHRTQVEVPQVVSWRLHERFRWPVDQVLLLSCGVIASPDRKSASVPLLNLDTLIGNTAGRADALLFIEFKGRAGDRLPTSAPQVASPAISVSRGRY